MNNCLNKNRIKEKAFRISVAVILLLAFVLAAANIFVILYGRRYVYPLLNVNELGEVDCIIVLGAAVYDDVMSHPLKQRVETGAQLYKAGVSKKIIVSGDNTRPDYDEVNVMKSALVNSGISPDVIFTDHAGVDTYDSMYRAKEIFKAERVVIVTQKFHLTRAIFIARSLGLEAYGVAADETHRYFNLKTEIREIFARPKYIFDAIFKPKPKFLGEEIPIWGEASLSDG